MSDKKPPSISPDGSDDTKQPSGPGSSGQVSSGTDASNEADQEDWQKAAIDELSALLEDADIEEEATLDLAAIREALASKKASEDQKPEIPVSSEEPEVEERFEWLMEYMGDEDEEGPSTLPAELGQERSDPLEEAPSELPARLHGSITDEVVLALIEQKAVGMAPLMQAVRRHARQQDQPLWRFLLDTDINAELVYQTSAQVHGFHQETISHEWPAPEFVHALFQLFPEMVRTRMAAYNLLPLELSSDAEAHSHCMRIATHDPLQPGLEIFLNSLGMPHALFYAPQQVISERLAGLKKEAAASSEALLAPNTGISDAQAMFVDQAEVTEAFDQVNHNGLLAELDDEFDPSAFDLLNLDASSTRGDEAEVFDTAMREEDPAETPAGNKSHPAEGAADAEAFEEEVFSEGETITPFDVTEAWDDVLDVADSELGWGTATHSDEVQAGAGAALTSDTEGSEEDIIEDLEEQGLQYDLNEEAEAEDQTPVEIADVTEDLEASLAASEVDWDSLTTALPEDDTEDGHTEEDTYALLDEEEEASATDALAALVEDDKSSTEPEATEPLLNPDTLADELALTLQAQELLGEEVMIQDEADAVEGDQRSGHTALIPQGPSSFDGSSADHPADTPVPDVKDWTKKVAEITGEGESLDTNKGEEEAREEELQRLAEEEARRAEEQRKLDAMPDPDLDKITSKDRVVAMLLRKQIVTVKEIKRASLKQKEERIKDSLWRILTQVEGVNRTAIFAEAARVYAFPIAKLGEGKPDPEFARSVTDTFEEDYREKLLKLHVVPYEVDLESQTGAIKVVFITHDPTRPEVHKMMKQLKLERFELRYAPEAVVRSLILEAFPRKNEFLERLDENSAFDIGMSYDEEATLVDEDALEAEISRSKLINLFEATLVEAVRLGVSDVHIWPNAKKQVEIHFRIDGRLQRWHVEDKVHPEALIAVIKDNSMNVDRFEREAAQDGYIQRWVDETLIRFRVSVMPIANAASEVRSESIVIRVLDDRKVIKDLSLLGLQPLAMERFNKAIRQPHGMVILTGPTGSGKTTTLYAALHEVVSPEVNVLTVEDPVEYLLPGVRQIKLNNKLGLEGALRNILRHDPDVVMVGEMRDRATAELAIKLANTGHLTFSTLHTNDAASAVTRLYKMGIEAFLIAYAINLVVAQRLIRKLCDTCKRVDEDPDPVLMKNLGFTQEEIAQSRIYIEGEDGQCGTCGGVGYKGRRAVSEALYFSRSIRHMIADAAEGGLDEMAIRDVAIKEGMMTLQDSAREVVKKGETSLLEMMRVVASGD